MSRNWGNIFCTEKVLDALCKILLSTCVVPENSPQFCI